MIPKEKSYHDKRIYDKLQISCFPNMPKMSLVKLLILTTSSYSSHQIMYYICVCVRERQIRLNLIEICVCIVIQIKQI